MNSSIAAASAKSLAILVLTSSSAAFAQYPDYSVDINNYAPSRVATYSFPKPNKVNCIDDNRYKLNSEAREGFKVPSKGSYYNTRAYKSWMAAIEKFQEQCERVCWTMPKNPPAGTGWNDEGYFGKFDKCSEYETTYSRLVRKQGDRITVQFIDTTPFGKRDKTPGEWNKHLIVKCSTSDYWRDSTGWTPVMPETRLDYAIRRYCN